MSVTMAVRLEIGWRSAAKRCTGGTLLERRVIALYNTVGNSEIDKDNKKIES